MRERPIMFSGAMVRAILAGTKTQTRRTVTTRHPLQHIGPAGTADDPSEWGWFFDGPDHHGYMVLGRGHNDRRDHGLVSVPCPYGERGDRLWVRESHRVIGWDEGGEATIEYIADGERRVVDIRADDVDEWVLKIERAYRRAGAVVDAGTGWLAMPDGREAPGRPSIFLERWASRIVLEVTDVRVERLRAITKADAIAEGAHSVQGPVGAYGDGPRWSMQRPHPIELDREGGYRRCLGSPQMAFANAWDSINGERAPWESNPWVWVVGFRRVQP